MTRAASSASCVRISRIARSPTKRALEPERAMFVSAFQDVYDTLPDGTLQLAPGQTVAAFLHAAFDAEEKVWGLDERGVRFYVAYDKESVVGYLSVDVNDGDSMYLRQMAVDTQWQRCGVGSKLVGVAVEEAGVDRVTVAVRRFNDDAKRFYGKLGFQEGGECSSGLNPKLYCGMVWDIGADAKS